MMPYINIADHYWIIDASATEVYSSKTNTMVPLADPDYVAWTAGLAAAPIASVPELAEVLRNRGSQLPTWLLETEPSFIQPAPGQYSKEQLKSYSAKVRWDLSVSGIVVNGIPFPTDARSLGALNTATVYTADKTGHTFSWKLPDGSFITLDQQGVEDLQNAVSDYGQRCFACEDQTTDAIDAGTVADLPAIEAAYTAISNEYTSIAVQRRK